MTGVAGTVGCEVPRPGRQAWHGQVRAVFARSAHLWGDGIFLTLGRPGLAAHPYSVLWPGFPDALVVGQAMTVTSEGLYSHGGVVADFRGMEVFSPLLAARPMAGKDRIALALSASLARAVTLPSRGGFHEVLIRHGHPRPKESPSRLQRHFAMAGARHGSALCQAMAARDEEGLFRAAAGLAGMGVGLTPAGDDLLAGVLAALRFYARSSGEAVFPEDRLEQVAGEAGKLTSPFSAFLLAAAARGLVAEPLADWLDAVHRGLAELAAGKVPEIAALGHSSGLDTLSGMFLALQTIIGERPWMN
jgi:hypothetical protein